MFGQEFLALEDAAQNISQVASLLETVEQTLLKCDADTNNLVQDARDKLTEASQVLTKISTNVENALTFYKKNQQQQEQQDLDVGKFLKNELTENEEISMKIEQTSDDEDIGDYHDDFFEGVFGHENDDDPSFSMPTKKEKKAVRVKKENNSIIKKSEDLGVDDKKEYDEDKPPEVFQCPECQIILKTKNNLRNHINNIHKGEKVTCDVCGFVTANLNYLKQHKKLNHPAGDDSVTCDICNKTVKNRTYLKMHMKNMHRGLKASCDLCNFQTSNTKYMKQHRETVHAGQQATCDICGFLSANENSLKRHKQLRHPVKTDEEETIFNCDECPATFKVKQYLQTHRKNVHNAMKVACELCGFLSANAAALSKHIKAKHTPGQRETLQCEKCEFTTHNKYILDCHIQAKHGDTKFQCDLCDFQTTTKKYLASHKTQKHEEAKFHCPKCDYSCHFRSILKTHIASVHEGVRFSCDMCDYSTGRKCDLKGHKREVHEGFRISCTECSFSTARKYKLKIHMRNKHKIGLVKAENEKSTHLDPVVQNVLQNLS
eukprot:TRINITY_DN4192_c0_g1_i1.p1 TRINITY_DN4192_c0_g1~~TRINITY_DN4192_c0_g1_i1.p1  ORF type:complete len:546 (+),score=113.23 TRINITY_DN4192_c0_g1_i1:64-1701(+)